MDESRVGIRSLTADDGEAAVGVVNTAAGWYREFLPPDELRDPEMTLAEWSAEARRMTWYGAFEDGDLVAVMGLEYVGDVALIRHAYVLPHRQRRRIARRLHGHIERQIHHGVERVIVGTYAANSKARRAFESFGYRLSPDSDVVLHRYYRISPDRRRSSVAYEKRRPAER